MAGIFSETDAASHPTSGSIYDVPSHYHLWAILFLLCGLAPSFFSAWLMGTDRRGASDRPKRFLARQRFSHRLYLSFAFAVGMALLLTFLPFVLFSHGVT
jgi:hypothetical protein